MKSVLRLLTAAAPLAVFFAVSSARADVAPMCNQYDADVDCAAADEGKACPGTSLTCYKIGCEGSGATSVYKCESCPVSVADTAKVCDGPDTFGKACGDGGTCSRNAPYCPSDPAATTYAVCLKDEPGQPTGGGGSDAGGAGGSVDGSFGGGGTQAGGVDLQGGGATVSAGGSQGATAAGAAAAAAPAPDDSGCSVVPGGQRGALAGFITMVSALALLVDRRRSKR